MKEIQNSITFYTSSFEDLVFLYERERQINLKYKKSFNNVNLTKFDEKWGKYTFKESDYSYLKNKELKVSLFNKFYIINETLELSKENKVDKTIYLFTKDSYENSGKISRFILFYEQETDLVKEIIKDIINCMEDLEKTEKSTLNIIIDDGGNLRLKPFQISSKEINFDKHYNKSCKEFVDELLDKVKLEKGLFLMHGKPGTGKTSLIRWIISVLDKKMIYIPPEMTSVISNPNFIKFLMNHPKSILVIEDAETVLMKRTSGGSSAIQNILNLCDGLLSDMLQIQVIATFNTDIKDIDPALLRPGRLNGIYEFKELDDDIAKNLCHELGVDFDSLREKTLAEIFNSNDKFSFNKKVVRKSIGFSSK